MIFYMWRLVLLLVLLAAAPDAYAAVTSSIVGTGTLQAPTGSTPLCSLDGAVNDLNVCTNDTLIYNIEYVTTGGDSSLTIVSTLPTCSAATTPGCPANGIIAMWDVLPPQCNGAGSGISANGLVLTCVRNGPINAGTARILPIVRVLGTVPNGATIPTPVTTVTTPETGAVVPAISTSGPVTVRAQPAFDLVKAPANQTTGGLGWRKGPDGVTDGWVVSFAAGVRVDGARGLESLDANGIAWRDVVGNMTVTATNSAATPHVAAVQAALRANAVLLPQPTPGGSNACVDNGDDAIWARYAAGMPWGRSGPNDNRLFTSGGCTVSQGGPGGTIEANIVGALWGNNVYPSRSTDGIPLPVGENYVAAKVIILWIPDSVLAPLPSGASIRINNTYSDVDGTSISGQPVVQPNTTNDTRSTLYTRSNGVGGGKRWDNYNSANDLRISGGFTRDGVVVDGMPAFAFVNMGANTTPVSGAVQCEKIDNTKFQIFDNPTVQGSSGNPAPPAGGYVIEYGTGGINGVGAGWANRDDYAWGTCADDQSPAWYASRGAVPGGDVAITKIRVRHLVDVPPTYAYYFRVPVRITATSPVAAMGVPVGHAWPIGTRVNNWSAFTYGTTGFAPGTAINVDSTGRGWGVGGVGATAYTSNDLVQHQRGDTITLVGARAEITKETSTPANNATQALGGQPITYVLKPVLTSAIATPLSSDMTIRDVLPPGLTYVAGSASLAPASVQFNTPSAGYTTLNWTLTNVAVGAPITPISFQALVGNTLANGTYIPNFTVVSSPLDTRKCDASGGAYDGILNNGYSVNAANGNVTGALCAHAARRDLRVSNPGGFQVNKTALTPQVEPGQTASYSLSWISVGNDLDVSDLIDILPFDGDSRSSTFNGTLTLAGALGPVSGDGGAQPSTILYTAAAPGSIVADPMHASNALPGGATQWCTAAQIGSGGCPASFAAVTAIRVRSNELQPDGIPRSLTVPLLTTGNLTGDRYRNNFTIRGSSGGVPLTAAVVAPAAQVDVVSGSIAGTVFRDDNDDGALNGADAGIGGVDVTLEGCGSGLDGIVQTASVGQSGAVACSGDDVPVTLTVQTAADGTYSFAPVLSGRYRLVEAQPAGYDDGKRHVGNIGGSVNAQGTVPSVIAEILLPAGTAAVTYDFAELVPNPRLTLIKSVTTDNGGTAGAGDFTLTASGPVTVICSRPA